jgi:hypothetical protein
MPTVVRPVRDARLNGGDACGTMRFHGNVTGRILRIHLSPAGLIRLTDCAASRQLLADGAVQGVLLETDGRASIELARWLRAGLRGRRV